MPIRKKHRSGAAPTILLRALFLAAVPVTVAACSSTTQPSTKAALKPAPDPSYVKMYGAIDDNGTVVPAVDVSKIDKRNLRQVVDYKTDEPVGTIVVDPHARFLYL